MDDASLQFWPRSYDRELDGRTSVEDAYGTHVIRCSGHLLLIAAVLYCISVRVAYLYYTCWSPKHSKGIIFMDPRCQMFILLIEGAIFNYWKSSDSITVRIYKWGAKILSGTKNF